MMKLSVLALLIPSALAFSAVAPKSTQPVDRSMRGIDQDNAFDPTEGEAPALDRNNKGDVWVPQVGRSVFKSLVEGSR